MAVNLAKDQANITAAWKSVADVNDPINWALFGYESQTNDLKLIDTGTSGLGGIVNEFNCSLIQYAFCRVIDDQNGINKLVLLHWQGESAPLTRKGLCASHIPDVEKFFKGCQQTITLRNDDEATPEYIISQIVRSSSCRVSLKERSSIIENVEPVGTNYKPLKVSQEIGTIDRKKFWQAEEEAEKQRILDEKRKAMERQAQFEEERKRREAIEAKKLQQAIEEREKSIEATRQATTNADQRLSSLSSSSTSTSTSQHNSILSTSGPDFDPTNDDNECVGRRSEMLRRERNQETTTLIGKGIIKNARAIFEQQAHEKSSTLNRPKQPPVRRNQNANHIPAAFRSNAVSPPKDMPPSKFTHNSPQPKKREENKSQNIDHQIENLAEQVKSLNTINDGPVEDSVTSEKEFAPILPPAAYNDQQPAQNGSGYITGMVFANGNKPYENSSDANLLNGCTPEVDGSVVTCLKENTNLEKSTSSINSVNRVDSSDINGTDIDLKNNNVQINGNNDTKLEPYEVHSDENVVANAIREGKLCAKALYDYQATDETEITFDPGDVIGDIEKDWIEKDSGWWHGTVLTGKFKGQTGLFPHNYVEILQ